MDCRGYNTRNRKGINFGTAFQSVHRIFLLLSSYYINFLAPISRIMLPVVTTGFFKKIYVDVNTLLRQHIAALTWVISPGLFYLLTNGCERTILASCIVQAVLPTRAHEQENIYRWSYE